MDDYAATISILLVNSLGLHARPSVKLTKLAKTFASHVEIAPTGEGPWVDAKSIVKVMAVKAAKGGQVEYRTEKSGIVQVGIGKASFTEAALVENLKALVGAVSRARPAGIKGSYIKRISLSSTMGPGLKLDIASVAGDNTTQQ